MASPQDIPEIAAADLKILLDSPRPPLVLDVRENWEREAARLPDTLDIPMMEIPQRLAELPRVVQGVVDHLAPHRLTKYARDVATEFHQFYTECTILADDRELRVARLALCVATKTVLAEVLELIGVSAPETM